ncbi:MAG: response regulator, partial [Candidatus Lokiarchaeota archaeon]|nr:response regulator [Candidatus Lokiarchaeota archaeon]
MTFQNVEILLIIDNPENIASIQSLLSNSVSFNYNIFICNTLSHGLKYILHNEIDVVLLALYLPDSKGFETFYKIRKKSRTTPIILLVSLEDEQLARNAIQLGAQDYLIEDQFDIKILEHALYSAITRHDMMLTIESLASEIQENEKRIKQIIEKNIDCIIITDKEGKIRFVNPAAEKYFKK